MAFTHYKQHDTMDCGPTCLRMVAKYHGKHFSLETLRNLCKFSKEGVSLLGISEAAEAIGFRARGVKLTFDQLMKDVTLPCIIHWRQNHFVVLPPQNKNNRINIFSTNQQNQIIIADPEKSMSYKFSKKEFLENWLSSSDAFSLKDGQEETMGIALLVEPTPAFHEQENERDIKLGWAMLLKYLFSYKQYITQLLLALLVGSLLQLIIPFLTQAMVDTGINTHDIQFIYIILIAQFMLFLGRTVVEFIRNRILLFISIRVNISILSDFWIKLMRLPLSFFDTKMTGDIMQRIEDHRRIETFLTGSTLNVIFSVINLIIFSIVLLFYNNTVFFIFAVGSILYFLWIKLFLKQRRSLDFKRFAVAIKENSATMQLIYGMQEIKLNGAEQLHRWEWEGYQASLFKLSFKSLSLNQYQQAGAFFINEGKNILITFFVATAVLNGQLTLGAMLAVQYIIGQLNSPVEQLINFAQLAQDAKISLERLNEIHQLHDEEPLDKPFLKYLPESKSITFTNLFFTYPGAGNEPVLKNINFTIPEGKITAIVGGSGSGKTTLLKLLLKFYENYKGNIRIGTASPVASSHDNTEHSKGVSLRYLSPGFWRSNCASVMQEGYIFNDTIARNIAVADEIVNQKNLVHACAVANILSFIESMPLGFNTKIGAEGNGISTGQKQRLLIARAVYKDSKYLFFDEATNSLDANNEKSIMENLKFFFNGKTVVIVAHRLSTVKNADSIIVLDDGEIIEQGIHEELTLRRGKYYELVKNQLELGN
ncbi:MAG: peptidase domain-containing ABC transporter [Ferruginibacter sp.]